MYSDLHVLRIEASELAGVVGEALAFAAAPREAAVPEEDAGALLLAPQQC